MEVPRFEQNAPNGGPNVSVISSGLDTSSSFEEANEEGPDAIIIAGDPQSADDVEFNQPNQHLIQDLDNENLPRKSDRSHLPESGTVPTAIFLGITNIVVILMVFLLPICCTRQGKTPAQVCLLEPFSWLLYCHTFYWLCHLVGDQYLKVEHRALRLRGYIEFYVKTKNIRRTPFYIISSFNAILLVTAVALGDYCDNNDGDPGCQAKETKIEVLRGLIVLEGLSVASMWLKYVMDHRKFTKEKSCPDMWREDFREKVLKPRLTSTPSEESESRQVYPERPPTQEYIMELQAELLVLLCPDIGQTEDLRQRITNYVRPITR